MTIKMTVSLLPPRIMSVKKASEYLGIHPALVRKYNNDGCLLGIRTLGGHRRFNIEDVKEFQKSWEKYKKSKEKWNYWRKGKKVNEAEVSSQSPKE